MFETENNDEYSSKHPNNNKVNRNNYTNKREHTSHLRGQLELKYKTIIQGFMFWSKT